MVQLEHCLTVVIVWRQHKVFQPRAEMIPRELECVLGLLSCMSGLNCCRAHSSGSEVLGSVTKTEVRFELPVFQGGSSVIEMRR
jgi:hypothetical protein